MRGRGFQVGANAPEFFQGLAGIGYQLLRASAPSVLPSVLAFDSPSTAKGRKERLGWTGDLFVKRGLALSARLVRHAAPTVSV